MAAVRILIVLMLLSIPISFSHKGGKHKTKIPPSDVNLLEFPMNLEYLEAKLSCSCMVLRVMVWTNMHQI